MSMKKDFKKLVDNAEPTIHATVVRVLMIRPFCGCYKKEQGLYEAWCSRVAETVENILEE